MNLYQRIEALHQLGRYMRQNGPLWQEAKARAQRENGWFVQEFIDLAVDQVVTAFLDEEALRKFADRYGIANQPERVARVGLVMAGNIPLVGFHDFLCVFLSGHSLFMKASAKDEVLIKHLVAQLWENWPQTRDTVMFGDMLKDCDAYIATGSNNTGRYFEYYFSRFPNIIRRNRTSAAILTGRESAADLEGLADDMLMYFGLGCRNVSKLYVPEGYDFVPLLRALDKYKWMEDHNKFRNNYEYHLSLHILNNKYYMTNGTVLLVEDKSLFSAISQVHYQYYTGDWPGEDILPAQDDLQCLVPTGTGGFGKAQTPALDQFADGVDTMKFLVHL